MTNDHDLESSFSIQNIISRASSSTSVGTVSNTNSLTASFAGRFSLEELATIKSHNRSNKQTIKSELTGEEVIIPWCGLRIGNRVYCTVKRKQGECFQDYASNKMESTSLINHLISDHSGLTQSRHNTIIKLLLYQQEQDPTYKIKYPGGEEKYNERFFHNCLTTESKPHLDRYEQEQNDINKMNKLPISRQSFLDLFTDFVIANNLPMVFSSKNVTLERLLQFSNRSNADNEKTISYNSMLIPPSNTKLKEFIIEKHKNQKRLVIEKLKQQKYINFTTDLWKSETNQYFMGITAHFIDQEWEPQQITIALKHMKNTSHAGSDLGRLFIDILEDYEIKSNLFCLITDNVSNNGKLADYLGETAERDPSFTFKRKKNLISCLSHVINIVCHDLIDKGLQPKGPTEDVNMEKFMKDVESDSSKKRQAYLDCQTRWNSTKVMIDRFLIMKEAYRLTINSEDDLRQDCSLNNAQIEYIMNIQKILTKFENITSWLSNQQYTTINKTIVLYNDLFTRLEKFQPKNPSLSAAIDLTMTKLSKYYSRTDLTDVYACATMRRQRKVFLAGYDNSRSPIIKNYVESNVELLSYIQTDHTQMFGREGLEINRWQEGKKFVYFKY
ncbi:hypothetical protein INT48_005684 [Thamnidium elegans]|uniref:Uncharacterized protein n=1 Tax=Thamnidium elegans TaxID=101142 RepID=A0A8H7SR37_9FUNG|nr:hypothetical protein INT48_005684 [Thamnidium elegans]